MVTARVLGTPSDAVLWEGWLPFVPRPGENIALPDGRNYDVRNVGYELQPAVVSVYVDDKEGRG